MQHAFSKPGGNAAIEAPFRYTVWTGVKPVNATYGPGGLLRQETGVMETRQMTVQDGRKTGEAFELDTHGFAFAPHPTRVADFFNAEELRNVYFPEVEALIKARSGADRVVVFDHTLRAGDEATRQARMIREPVRAVHNDYTEWSGPQRVRDLMGDEAETLLRHRFAIIQVWRAINRPIASDPLAIADARSLDESDFIAAERRHPDRVGEIYQFKFNPRHRWYYFPRMRREEALVFKVYDSAKDGRARWTAHSSFVDPSSAPDAPPRESIEIRAFAFFTR